MSYTRQLTATILDLKMSEVKIKVDIKLLSVNKAWRGRRFKTDAYERYSRDLMFLLPKVKMPPPPYEIRFVFGFSSKLSDWDNPIKPLQDIICKKYKFDDRDIYRAIVDKEIVPIGKEFFEFEIRTKV